MMLRRLIFINVVGNSCCTADCSGTAQQTCNELDCSSLKSDVYSSLSSHTREVIAGDFNEETFGTNIWRMFQLGVVQTEEWISSIVQRAKRFDQINLNDDPEEIKNTLSKLCRIEKLQMEALHKFACKTN